MGDSSVYSHDLYERLGLAVTATLDQIKKAYRQLVKKYPPEAAPEEFKRIREAYETLSNPLTRHEYDERPDPVVAELLGRAEKAMHDQDFASAISSYKEVLVRLPDLHFARNLLGLCFLYQRDAEKAIGQYERLLDNSDGHSTWWGNAAYAYRMAKRYMESEHSFKEAILRSTDVAVDYYIGLADLYLEQSQNDNARNILERGIGADGHVDFADLRFMMKLLEVHLRSGDINGVQRDVRRFAEIASDDGERATAALRLGELAQDLILGRGYEYARIILNQAAALQPDDDDYPALLELIAQLEKNKFSAARNLMSSHPSFASDGWMSSFRRRVEDQCSKDVVLENLEPITSTPGMFTLYGIGTRLYGSRDHDSRTGSYIATLYFVVLFIPIFPLACYRVIAQGDRSWSFLGKVPFSNAEKTHLNVALVALAGLLLWGIVAGNQSSTSSSSYTPRYSLPSETTPAPVSPSDSFESWYNLEKARITRMKDEIGSIDQRLQGLDTRMKGLAGELRVMEGQYRTRGGAYKSLTESYDASVNEYNTLLRQRRQRYAEYKKALAAANLRIELHNRRR